MLAGLELDTPGLEDCAVSNRFETDLYSQSNRWTPRMLAVPTPHPALDSSQTAFVALHAQSGLSCSLPSTPPPSALPHAFTRF